MKREDILVWLDVTLEGNVTGLHVRWKEAGEWIRHDEQWDDELEMAAALTLIDFIRGTA